MIINFVLVYIVPTKADNTNYPDFLRTMIHTSEAKKNAILNAKNIAGSGISPADR